MFAITVPAVLGNAFPFWVAALATVKPLVRIVVARQDFTTLTSSVTGGTVTSTTLADRINAMGRSGVVTVTAAACQKRVSALKINVMPAT